MNKQETFDINNLIILDSQNKVKDRVTKGAIIHVGDEHYAQATQILEKHQVSFGNVRDKDLGVNSIIIH
jgi:D-tyrosyl-tRNA(Tyr) deacylase